MIHCHNVLTNMVHKIFWFCIDLLYWFVFWCCRPVDLLSKSEARVQCDCCTVQMCNVANKWLFMMTTIFWHVWHVTEHIGYWQQFAAEYWLWYWQWWQLWLHIYKWERHSLDWCFIRSSWWMCWTITLAGYIRYVCLLLRSLVIMNWAGLNSYNCIAVHCAVC